MQWAEAHSTRFDTEPTGEDENMKTNRIARLVLGSAAITLLLPGRAEANDVNPGHDLFVTGDGSSHDFADTPIPADFFAPGSDPFTDVVALEGAPIGQFAGLNVGNTDTIVERPDVANLPVPGPSNTIDIELVALSLKSVEPITVTFNGGQDPEQWDVHVSLSPTARSVGIMTIAHSAPGGGTYNAILSVAPLFTFAKVANPSDVRVLDTAVEGIDPIQMGTTNSPHRPGSSSSTT